MEICTRAFNENAPFSWVMVKLTCVRYWCLLGVSHNSETVAVDCLPFSMSLQVGTGFLYATIDLVLISTSYEHFGALIHFNMTVQMLVLREFGECQIHSKGNKVHNLFIGSRVRIDTIILLPAAILPPVS